MIRRWNLHKKMFWLVNNEETQFEESNLLVNMGLKALQSLTSDLWLFSWGHIKGILSLLSWEDGHHGKGMGIRGSTKAVLQHWQQISGWGPGVLCMCVELWLPARMRQGAALCVLGNLVPHLSELKPVPAEQKSFGFKVSDWVLEAWSLFPTAGSEPLTKELVQVGSRKT